MKTTKSRRKFCAILPLRVFAGVLLALCTALTIVACKNPMIDEFLGYPKLTVTAPQFSEVVSGGYTPVARQIVILNVGKRAAGIKSVTVSPDTAFTIGPVGSSAVGSGKNIANWTVQPKANLGAGAHKATITVTYRGAGVDSAKATAEVEFVVVAPGAPTPTLTPVLTVTVPTFTSVAEGYTTRPAAQNITIRNIGNAQATIASISVSPADKFDVNTSTGTVNGNNATTTRTVQPKAGLTRGVYMALITVTYNGTNGTTVSAAVSFEVTQAVVTATRTLVVTPPIFDVVTIGSRPAAQSIIIENTGNATATISSVAVSDTTKFTLGGSGSVVGAQSSIAGRTVQPKAGLAAGTHTATITVTYNGTSGPTATASVTFTVMPFERFVAVAGSGDQVAYSSDGSSWKTAPMTTYENWTAVTYGGGKFVAVARTSNGGTGTNKAAYSFDGINWIPTTMPTTALWYSITYGNGMFVATAIGSDRAGAAYSSDGVTWTRVDTSMVNTNLIWTSVAYGNNRFVILEQRGHVKRSTDGGINWSDATWLDNFDSAGGAWQSITYGYNRFVAVNTAGHIGVIGDAVTGNWIKPDLAGAWNAVTYGNNTFVAVASGSNQIATSADGINWTTGALPASGNWNSLTYAGGKFIAVANDKVAYSTTGVIGTWTIAAMPAGSNWKSVAYGVAPH
ncbi:MAG: hypothetical protein Ta2A_15040 [Treponemataceae bacterium]|nr:MAG: hypothetical protein Ta2A_15040 [Treponemataceae bacterium]